MSSEDRFQASEKRRVDVVIPVLNEAHVLEKSVETLLAFLAANLPYAWKVVIVDNGSRDGTDQVARRLAAESERVEFVRLTQPGRGRALRQAWMQSDAEIVCYMDVDLSTDLAEIPKLIDAIAVESFDLSVGSRLLPGSRTQRSLKRDVISRVYNIFLRLILRTGFSDAQTGFKAVHRRVVQEVVPQVEDESWFFDTELLVLAERQGYRIKDIPVAWLEDDDSRVKIIRTAWEDIKGVFRVRRRLAEGLPRAAAAAVPPKEKP